MRKSSSLHPRQRPKLTMSDAKPDPIPISALQHYLFCPRQCALIHIEQAWAEDAATMEGRILHEAVDAGESEVRGKTRIARGVGLYSHALGLIGKADVVEFRGSPPIAFPIEYKRGKPKTHRADEVQLCAQALCLEEMTGSAVPEGALFYGEKRRRHAIVFDDDLRTLTKRVCGAVHEMMASARTPPAVFTPSCRKCSLEPICRPKQFATPPKVEAWLSNRLSRALADEA